MPMHKNKNTKKKTKLMYGGTAKKKMQMGGAPSVIYHRVMFVNQKKYHHVLEIVFV